MCYNEIMIEEGLDMTVEEKALDFAIKVHKGQKKAMKKLNKIYHISNATNSDNEENSENDSKKSKILSLQVFYMMQ